MTEDNQGPLYSDVNLALARCGAAMGAAEAHGLLCGLLCASERIDSVAWLTQIMDTDDHADADQTAARSVLMTLLSETVRQFNDEDFGFYPLVPDDDTPLQQRTTVLKDWCEGFLLGLGSAGIHDHANLPEGTDEVIQDLIEVTRLDTDTLGVGETEEEAYAEIYEYVRMGAMLIREELRAVQRPRPDDAVVH